MTPPFEIIPDAGHADTLAGRCEAMTIGDLPPYRCTREAGTDRNGRRVCEAHGRKLAIKYFDDHSETF